MKILLNLLIGAPISLSASGDEHRRAVPSSPTNHYPRPLQSQTSGWILRGSSRMTSIVQWLVSLSRIPNLTSDLGEVSSPKARASSCTTENISVNVHVENISTKLIIQQLKSLLYKDFVSFLDKLTALKSGGMPPHACKLEFNSSLVGGAISFHPTPKGRAVSF